MAIRFPLFAILVLTAAGCGRPVPKTDPSVTDPDELYQTHCARCHARRGEPGGPEYGGSIGPPLGKIGSATGMTAEYLAEYIADSKQKRKVSGMMPAFGGKLTDEQIKALAGWLAAKK